MLRRRVIRKMTTEMSNIDPRQNAGLFFFNDYHYNYNLGLRLPMRNDPLADSMICSDICSNSCAKSCLPPKIGRSSSLLTVLSDLKSSS